MSDERYRCSFDGVADVYERSRPGYAPAAVAWIAERLPMGRVLDLAAGTGKLTRQLVPYAREVVAVEPGDEMRRVLESVVPRVDAVFGTAETIPLPDGSVDCVTVAQAFHWFETDVALAEMHRVLRPGGGYAIVWNEWDEHDWLLAAISEVVDRLRGGPARNEEKRDAVLASTLFSGYDEREFSHVERIDAGTVVDRVSSISALVAAPREDRERALAEVRALVGTGAVDIRNVTWVIAADRV